MAINEKVNQEIDALAYSLRYDKLSAGQYEYKQTQLFKKLLEIKKKARKNAEIINEDHSVGESITTEEVEDAYLSAWEKYINGEDASFIKIFNTHFKINDLWCLKRFNEERFGNACYKKEEAFIKETILEIVQELKIKDFEMPINVKSQETMVKLTTILKGHGATDAMIDRLNSARNVSFWKNNVNYSDDGEEISVFDTIADDSHNADFNDNCYDAFVKLCKNLDRFFAGRADKLYCKYFISCKFAETFPDDDNLYFIKKELGDLLDFKFIELYRKEEDEKEDEFNETRFLADYLGKEYETVQRQIKAIRDKFEEIRIKHLI
ncbi:MAG: hypothetical protein KBS60_00625 [Phascolarctobacterium sp.]|nr:hypothetical protein [Candidatus Phascolarctobacterium caballi]